MLVLTLSSADLKLADPGITTEPRGLTETQSRLADLFTTAAVPGRSAGLDVCGLFHCSSVWPRRQPLIANCHTSGNKFLNCVARAPAFRVSFASSTFEDLLSHLAFKPAEVKILSKTLSIEDG